MDAFDAATVEEALLEIKRNRGKQLDPQMARLLTGSLQAQINRRSNKVKILLAY
ncbi:HD-GYP domain-containing protein (c-di-GMP phosphodiesterase class II) [Anaerotaenia torta]|uniref:hypothetical protein n=1 Tax=Anaerotaenia torta TaxID=433293 RepID=UPI003D262E17